MRHSKGVWFFKVIMKVIMVAGGILGVIIASPMMNAVSKEGGQSGGGASQLQLAPQQVPQQVAPPAKGATEKFTLNVHGMKNPGDQEKIKNELKQNPGIIATNCDQKVSTCSIEIDPSRIKKEDVAVLINKLGYQAELKS